MSTREHQRLDAHRNRETNWKLWGPYLSERAWGTVREDYSRDGNAWDFFPHDHARSRAYRWNEDGLAGISDRYQYLCFALALWNGKDSILKERLFGLTGEEGNHGEDVKEYYFYLDCTPTHSYMKMLYKYPQAGFPYRNLVEENKRRSYNDFEYELLDTGVFDGDQYVDIFVEYAKASEQDILIRITAVNRGPKLHELTLIPTLWYRNTWSWGYPDGPMHDVTGVPNLQQLDPGHIRGEHPTQGVYHMYAESPDELIFTNNETNNERLFGLPNSTPYVKDAFHRYIINGEINTVNPAHEGTKAAAVYRRTVAAGETREIRLRLAAGEVQNPFADFDNVFSARIAEADEFYAAVQLNSISQDERLVQRQVYAGMLWSKQLYYYDVTQWLDGDPAYAAPPFERRRGRNKYWRHLNNFDVLSMPDKWEYPWYAVWDLAFHCIPLVHVDPQFAKRQLELITREWYMHPNGQLPAYEWSFNDVHPPVHAWATWLVYQIDGQLTGEYDRAFLESIFHKLLLNFTWWVNRKDEEGDNIFEGGFLGLDNISIFDRSRELPGGSRVDQADGTAWMGFFALSMLKIALELARENPVYQDMATKFYEHFLAIANAMTEAGHHGHSLWNEEDDFFYDMLHLPGREAITIRVRSLVGLMPLLATETIEPWVLENMDDFCRRMNWFTRNRPDLSDHMASVFVKGQGERRLLSVLTRERLIKMLRYMLDENEFLSPYGIRSLSKVHETPYHLSIDGENLSIDYQPAESESGLFGGNSNWRGPIWFPINYLLIETLRRFHEYYGDDLKVEMPTGSGILMTLSEIADDLSRRLIRLFIPDEHKQRPIYGGLEAFQKNQHWHDYLLFHEYFHGDNGAGLGASHQTGWTGLVAQLIDQIER